MARGDDIQERLINFAVAILKLAGELPKNTVGNHIFGQLIRCGTSGAPNYSEARGAESSKDFVHKLGVVLKELNETGIWLEIIKRAGILQRERIIPVADECSELSRIINSSIQTVRQKKQADYNDS